MRCCTIASIHRNIPFTAPHPSHPSACKGRPAIPDQSSIRPLSMAAAASPQSSAAFSSQRSWENHLPPKPLPLPHQIPIDGQALTAFPRVRSSEASRRRPPILRQSLAPGRHPKSFTIPDLPALASEQGGSTPKPSFAARETSAARESYRSTMPRGSLDCDKLRLSIRAPRWFALR